MSYVSLYRKYRSQTFDDVVGQEHVVKTIKNAIRAGNIAHGYLFCGSRGTGKTTVARIIAKALNCMQSPNPTPDPCNQCEACRSITDGSAVDVIEMDAASNRSVDDVDALREGVKYPPMHLRYKVYIIDEAHQLSPQAKDAFLKTLEEPPPHAIFILATTEAGKIPVTIRSRCQQFDFRRGSVEQIKSRLSYVAKNENISIDDDALELIARLASGSYRDALSIMEQLVAYTEGTITTRDVHTVVGSVDEDVLFDVTKTLASGNLADAFALADRLVRQGGDVRELLKSIAIHFRDLLEVKVGANIQRASNVLLKEVCDRYTTEQLLQVIEVFSAAEKDLRYSENEQLAMELAFIKAMRCIGGESGGRDEAKQAAAMPTVPNAEPTISEQTQKDARVEIAKSTSVAVAAAGDNGNKLQALEEEEYDPFSEESIAYPVEQTSGEQRPSGTCSLEEIQNNWQKILDHLKKVMKRASLAAQAREGRPVKLDGSVLTIAFQPRYKFHHDGTLNNAELIAQAIEQVMGVRLTVTTTLEDQSETQHSTDSPIEPQEHPQKQEIITTFNGWEVEPGPDPWEGV
ncbi:MAG: DNA polymerase III subunit gamma/tau [Armatimonadota bacterium]